MSDVVKQEEGLSPTTSFEQLGIKNKFGLKDRTQDIQVTDIIPLPGIQDQENKYSVTCIKTPQPSGLAKYYSVILFGGKDSSEAIGHLDFRVYNDEPVVAKATESIYPEILPETSALPETLRKGIATVSKMDASLAMQIADNYQGKGLGGLLWSLGCGFMELQGAKEIFIDDRTKRATGTSFYERFGAFYKEGKRKKLVFGQGAPTDVRAQQLYASTHLNDEQGRIIKKSFAEKSAPEAK